MKVQTREYRKKEDGTWDISLGEKETNPNDFQFYNVNGLPDVLVGVRYEKDGKVIIPEEPDAPIEIQGTP